MSDAVRKKQCGHALFDETGGTFREILGLGNPVVWWGGSLAVVVRERRRDQDDAGPRPNMKVVALNVAVGVVLTVWGLGSIIAAH